MKSIRFGCCLLILSTLCLAGDTRTWEHSSQADFEKGKLNKLSLRSDGRLTLSPVFKELYDPSSAYLWSLAEDSKGNLFVGGSGSDATAAKLFQIDAAGKGSVFAELPGLSIQAVAVDAQDRVYAATSPDGKVYRVSAPNKFEVFYDPKAKYIWALVFNRSGDLFVATGDKGEIHRVTAAGAGSVFFKTEETHARSLVIDAQGNLYAGTDPGGLVLRITPAGEGFVLYQTSKREVTALAVHSNGSVYAAAVGNKTPATQLLPPPAPVPPAPAPVVAAPGAPAAVRPPQPAPVPSMAGAIQGGSEVWRMEPDGYPRKLWSNASDIVYAIAFDRQGRAILGTGNKGAIYRLDTDLLSTLLLNASPTQVTALLSGRQGRVVAITGNIGKTYQLGPEAEKEGTYESEALDATYFTYWGRLHYTGTLAGGNIAFETHSGNLDLPQKNWSPWVPLPLTADSGRVASPAARFLQYRIKMTAAPQGQSPELSSIDIAYLPKNVAPAIEIIGVTPANYRFPAQVLNLPISQTINLPALGRGRASTSSTVNDNPASSMTYAKGHIGARWMARDENGDALLSKVEIRGVNETAWKLLKDQVKERNLSWDSTAFPDGEYRLRVTVSDSPSNPPAQALTASQESDPFVIDNTPPAITGVAATRNGARAEIRWKAVDALHVIGKAEYSLNGGEWLGVEPTTRLSDSRAHDYLVTLDNLAPGEHTIAVRVTDEADNQAVDKAVVR